MIYPKMLFFCADFPREQGTNCTGGARRRSCLAKRMECVELAPAVGCVARFESGSKLHALHTLRAIWFRLCRAGDRRALPAITDYRRVTNFFPRCLNLRYGEDLNLTRL